MRLAIVTHVTGTLLRLFSPGLVIPAGVAAIYREWRDVAGFLLAFGLAAIAGTMMRRVAGPAAGDVERPRRVEGLAIVAVTWLLVAHVAAVPYTWAGLGFIDALFEAMSGMTTTGATILVDFTAFGYGVFFWRSMTEWLGGLGV